MRQSPHKSRSAGGIVQNKNGDVAMVYELGWYLPKGRVEQPETDLQAAEREIREEAGITQLELVRDLGEFERFAVGADGKDNLDELKTIHLFFFTTNQEELSPQDPHITDAQWVQKDKVCALLSNEKDREFVKKALAELN